MSERTIRLAVLGEPIEHSLSPKIHALFAQQTHRPVDYRAIHCPAHALSDQLRHLHETGHQGLNLTVPLKEHALDVCEGLSVDATQAGAVNTLLRTETGWWGANTDGAGLVNDMRANGLALADQRLLIIGAGGATAGIVGPLLAAGASQVAVMNRTLARAQALCDRFADARLSAHPLTTNAPPPATLAPFDGLIQATSQGHQGALTLPDARWWTPQAWCYDLNYGPAHRPLFEWASANDRPVVDGLGMLVQQAALSFELWMGVKPDATEALAALRDPPTSC
ncbi:MAG: shikimate dehydrogenase [Wenzhouxiangella sp.]|nr:shikimate dehydrogenase [Wenzhouxiangella sp.]